MELKGKTKDQAIGSLLRAYVSRPTNPGQACTDFDPDYAAAYVERRLTTPERTRYEAHLSGCAPCRKGVVTLSRLALPEPAASIRREPRERASWLSRASGFFGVLTPPQWAMAAAAVIVLAVSLPILLSRSQHDLSQAVNSVDQNPAAETANSQPSTGATAPVGSLEAKAPPKPALSESNQVEKRASEPSPVSGGQIASNRPAPSANRESLDELQKAETRPQAQPVNQLQTRTDSQLASQAAAQPTQAPGETQQAKKDSDGAQQQGKEVAQTAEPKPPAPQDAGLAEKNGKAEQAAAAPPPDSSRLAEPRRKLSRSRAQLGLRDSSANESVSAAGREIRGKKFFLRDGTWTDKDYDPDKDLPTITLIRDSNVYKEVLSKRASLKPYLTSFAETERAIIVYKGTVYKLIPQNGDK